MSTGAPENQIKAEPTEFQRFHAALSRAIKVPKAEILRREKADKEARRQAKERKAKQGYVNPVLLVLVLPFWGFALTVWPQQATSSLPIHLEAARGWSHSICNNAIPSNRQIELRILKAVGYSLDNGPQGLDPTECHTRRFPRLIALEQSLNGCHVDGSAAFDSTAPLLAIHAASLATDESLIHFHVASKLANRPVLNRISNPVEH